MTYSKEEQEADKFFDSLEVKTNKISKAHDLLVKLNNSIQLLNLDMSGKHTYMLSPKSHTILTEIRHYLSEETSNNCTICKINPATVLDRRLYPGATKLTVCKECNKDLIQKELDMIVKESYRRKQYLKDSYFLT